MPVRKAEGILLLEDKIVQKYLNAICRRGWHFLFKNFCHSSYWFKFTMELTIILYSLHPHDQNCFILSIVLPYF